MKLLRILRIVIIERLVLSVEFFDRGVLCNCIVIRFGVRFYVGLYVEVFREGL